MAHFARLFGKQRRKRSTSCVIDIICRDEENPADQANGSTHTKPLFRPALSRCNRQCGYSKILSRILNSLINDRGTHKITSGLCCFRLSDRCGECSDTSMDRRGGNAAKCFASANEIRSYTGVAPLLITVATRDRSAVGRLIFVFYATIHEWAGHSIQTSVWARSYHDELLSPRRKSIRAAVRPLAYKWIGILVRGWKDRTPYLETFHQVTRARRTTSATSTHFPVGDAQWKK